MGLHAHDHALTDGGSNGGVEAQQSSARGGRGVGEPDVQGNPSAAERGRDVREPTAGVPAVAEEDDLAGEVLAGQKGFGLVEGSGEIAAPGVDGT